MKLTNQQVRDQYEAILNCVETSGGTVNRDDYIAMRESFNSYIYDLHRVGLISDHQVNTITNPY